ncbi:APC family permease [Brachybacterium huguangmaarense]|uniref:APC family permease n=1 Tax=Brachybacterium huguangmaarense TaxID=1652028 RepID=A0ABY6G2C7_9MICO|nr:APC family permease [Brachybacterium huguangmaarense]UYG16819.1 APC family permease [Brachybacterium huguangmaarense]
MSSTASSRPAVDDPSGPTELRREISFGQLIAYGLVFIGPAAAVGVWGTLDAKSGGVVPVVYLVATLAMALTASSYAVMSRVVPRAGSVFAYASEAIGRRTGHMAGWMVLLDYILIPSVAYLFTGIALNSLFPSVPVWVFVAVAVVLTTALNLSGVRVTSRVSMVVVLVEVAVLLVVLVVGVVVLVQHGPVRGWLDPFTGGSAGLHPHLILGAVAVAVLSYLGFDALATFAEETRGPASVIGRATVVCLVVAGVLFMAQTYIGALLSPLTTAELQAHPEEQGAAYYTMVDQSISPVLHWLLALAKAVGAAFSALVGQAAGSRVLMDMGRSGSLPRFFSRVSPRTGAPLVGTLVAAAGNVVVSLWAASRPDGLDHVVSIVDVGALVGFVLVHVSVIAYAVVRHRDGPVRPIRHLVVPILGIAVLVTVLVNSTGVALVVGAIWALLGVIVLVAGRSGRRTTAPTP